MLNAEAQSYMDALKPSEIKNHQSTLVNQFATSLPNAECRLPNADC